MKGEYQEEKQDHHHHHTHNTNMFYKLQQQQTQTFHQHQNQLQPTFRHPFHIAANTTTTQTSEEADSRRSPTHNTSTTPKTTTSNKKQSSSSNNPSSHDGATIEVIRRPRGRPPGSKNKAKPPIIITKEPEPSMSPYVLELPPNVDIIQSVFHFCHKRNINLCIFNGSGSVTNVTLHQPSSTPGATVTFHGRFDILSISATILLSNNNKSVDNSAWPSSFTITLGGPQGQVFGGAVMGPLASSGTIYLIASTFNNPTHQKLPFDDNNEARNALVMSDGGGGGGDEGQRHHHSPSGVSGGGGSGDNQMAGMYSNFQADVIWAPIARPPPPY